MSANPIRRHRLAFVLAILTVTAVPVTLLAPVAGAQVGDDVSMRFDREPPHYMQGESVEIRLQGTFAARMEVRVACVQCPDANVTYTADAASRLVFPEDFGERARNDRQPRWNATWRVELVWGASTLETRYFNTWTANLYEFPDLTPMPTTSVTFRSAGLVPENTYRFEVQQRREDGSFETRFRQDVRPTDEGVAEATWRIPTSEAERFHCPGRKDGYCEHHELTITGPGKPGESLTFTVRPARVDLRAAVGGTPEGEPATHERTMTRNVVLDLRYPGGRQLTWEDVRGPRNPDGVLAVGVERLVDDAWERFDVLNLSFINNSRMWSAEWTIPRDAPLEDGADYRLAILPDEDRFGNVIRHEAFANFTVEPATLVPRIVDQPREAERLDLTRFIVAFRYHDGTPFEPGDNVTALTGCFPRDENEVAGCGGDRDADVTYWDEGLWNFTYRFPRDYENLQDHRFRFEGSEPSDLSEAGEDTWGNAFRGFVGEIPFRVIPASPRVNLTTTVDGEIRSGDRGWDRGDNVALTARITYPDGSPFNRTVNAGGRDHLNATLVKHGPDEAPSGYETVRFESTSREGPVWAGRVRLAMNASDAPAGNWRLVFDVADDVAEPNRNETAFARVVNPATISATTIRQPPAAASIGSTVEYRFRLTYPDGSPVTSSDVGSRLYVNVERVTPGEEGVVSGDIFPTYDPGKDEWSVEWTVPRELYQGTYVVKPAGTDRHGNVMAADASSRTFTTFTSSSTRDAIVQPSLTVKRGGAVMAIFDGRDTDLHYEPENRSAPPVIRLERYDPGTEQWRVIREDVRVADADAAPDHVARFNTTVFTQLGVHRFHLMGRDGDFNLINGTTREFTLEPTEVTRPLLVPPPDRVAKGQPVAWEISREDGDRITGIRILYEGRPLQEARQDHPSLHRVQQPVYSVSGPRFEFVWRVPVDVELGEYAFVVTARDGHGNFMEVPVPAVRTEPSVLDGRVVGHPEPRVPRGDDATFLFGVRYASGNTFQGDGTPRVIVMSEDGYVADADVTRHRTTFEATWTPSRDEAVGDYWFEVTGVDDAGNVFPALASDPVHVTQGAFERDFEEDASRTYNRLGTVELEVLADASDAFVAFTLEYLGTNERLARGPGSDVEGTTVANLEHRLDNATGRYVVTWDIPRDERAGAYRIAFTGQDADGNAFHGESRAFLVRPLQYGPVIRNPGNAGFAPGEVHEWTFSISRVSGDAESPDPATMHPEARILWERRPLKDVPDTYYDPERGLWVAAWHVPDELPPGRYELLVQGQDDVGNTIVSRSGGSVDVEEPAVVQGLVRAVPAGAAPFALIILAAAALFGRRRHRDA